MTDCAAIRPELGGYVLGGLDPGEVAAVEDHLDGCASCRAERDELAPLPELLRLASPEATPAPADLRPRVLRAQLLCGGRLEDYDRITVTWHGFHGDYEVVAAQAPLTA